MWSDVVLGIIGVIAAICILLDLVLSREEEDRGKTTLIQWWVRLQEFSVGESIRQASIFFNRRFDLFYGPKALSWRRVWASSLTTVVIVSIVAAIYYLLGGYTNFLEQALIGFGVANLIADYLSLNKTRLLLRLSESASGTRLCLLLLVDLAATVIIFCMCFGLWLTLSHPSLFAIGPSEDYVVEGHDYSQPELPWPLRPFASLALLYDGLAEDYLLARVFFVAAFGASLMFFAFLAVALMMRLVGVIRPRAMNLLERLERSGSIFKSIGLVLGALLMLGKGICQLVAALAT